LTQDFWTNFNDSDILPILLVNDTIEHRIPRLEVKIGEVPKAFTIGGNPLAAVRNNLGIVYWRKLDSPLFN